MMISRMNSFFTSVSKENFTLPLHGLSFKSGLYETYGRKSLGCCILFYASANYSWSKYDQQVAKQHAKIIIWTGIAKNTIDPTSLPSYLTW